MEKKAINSFADLSDMIKEKDRSFLMLYKSGSEQSECAVNNLMNSTSNNYTVFYADVSKVRDIHENYNITSVPTLIEFKFDKPLQIIKGCHDKVFYKSLLEKSLYSTSKSGEGNKQKRVIVYTTPTCPHCTTLKNYLKELKIPFKDVNVAQDQKMAEAMVKKSGQQGVPQIEINGRIVVGFNKAKIDELLEIK